MYKRLLTVLLVFSLFGFSSCGESDEVDNPTPPQEQPSNPDGGKDDGDDGGENNGEEDGSESVDPLPDNIELGENTVQLSKAQKDNIESVDDGNTTLSFSLSTPEDQIPEVGQIILQLEPTESLPFGFLGRVTNVTNNGAAIVVETEAPALIEAFDKLEFDEELKILQDPTRFSWGTDEYGYHYFSLDANANVELRPGVFLELSGDITFSSKTTSKGEFNKYLNKEDLDFDIKTKIAAQNLALKLTGKIDNSGSNFMKIPVGPAIPFTGLLGKLSVEAALQLYAGGKLSGEAGLQIGFSHESAKSFHIKSENGSWIEMQPSSDDGVELASPEGEATFSPEVSFYLEGSAMLGFFTGFELKLFGRDEYKLSLAPYAGYEISSNQNLINFADLDYEESKDVHVTGAVVAGVEASANATFFNHKVETTFFDMKWRGAEIHRYLFPTFEGSYEVDESNIAKCEMVVARDVLIPMEVGIGKYYNDAPLSYYSAQTYHMDEDFQNPYTAKFLHAEGDSYWSYVKWLNKYIRCTELDREDDDIRALLEKFYNDTGGDNWTYNENWCTDAPLTEWYGVGVYKESKKYYLTLSSNNLTGSGSLADFTALAYFDCSNNQLTSLDVAGCSALYQLDCSDNQLTNLNILGCDSLRSLGCAFNNLTDLDVSHIPSIEKINAHWNLLKNLNVSGCTALKSLECESNQLTNLNLSDCTALQDLSCDQNQLTSLDVSNCTELEFLWCHNNKINQVITDFYDRLVLFSHDQRYWYYGTDEYGRVHYTDNGVGWWYPGEPQKGYHGK